MMETGAVSAAGEKWPLWEATSDRTRAARLSFKAANYAGQKLWRRIARMEVKLFVR
jgi:hypothetical protein